MASYNAERAVSIPCFDGVRSKYTAWLLQMKAYARLFKFTAAIGDALEADMPADETVVIDKTTPAGKLQDEAVQRNNAAMAVLTQGDSRVHPGMFDPGVLAVVQRDDGGFLDQIVCGRGEPARRVA